MQPNKQSTTRQQNAAVEQAKADGATEVNNVNPTPEAKPAAKKAIDDALKAKNDAIDANNDLTAEEKAKLRKTQKRKLMQRSKQSTTRQQMQR